MPKIVGIDLGTTNSCIAVYENGVKIIETEDGRNAVPSAVFYGDNGEIIVGHKAIKKSAINPTNGIYDAKRLIGCKFSSENIAANIKTWAFDVVEGRNDETEIVLIRDGNEVRLRPEDVSAEILKVLKQNAEKYLKEKIINAVITVPAYFTNSQKEATKKAAELAGLNVIKLVPEPTAAALAFTHNSVKKNSTILVYDLGGGTFDVSLIKLSGTKIKVLAVEGEKFLGGRDFDKKLFRYILKLIEEKYEIKLEGLKMRRIVRRLEQECEHLKKTLSDATTATYELYEIQKLKNVELSITRQKFEEINEKLFKETIEIMDKMLANAKINKNKIDEVVLAGGSTRIPKIHQLVKDYFNGKEPNKTVNPDEVVAIGAAYQAALLSEHPSQKFKNYVITDIVPHSLGIEITIQQARATSNMDVIIQKHKKIPCAVEKIYYTGFDFQKATTIRIFEGESNLVEENTLLGEFVIDGITPKPKGQVKFIVKFQLDKDGILHVTAKENSKNITKDLTIQLVNGS